MKKRNAVALFTAAALTVGTMAGCGGNGNSQSQAPAGADAQAEQNETSGGSGSGTNEEAYNVVIENVTLGAEYKDTQAIEEAINAITQPAINCTVTILNVGIADHANRMSMMIAGGEKLDLCMTGLTTNLVGMSNDGMLTPLDEYIDTAGADIKTILGDDLDVGRVNGILYGIAGNNTSGRAGGFIYNKEMADEAGVEIPNPCTMDDLLAAYEKIKETNPDVYFTSLGNGEVVQPFNCALSTFGDSSYFSYGVIVEPFDGNTTIENWYASDAAKEYYTIVKEWQNKKIVPADSMTSGVIPQDLFKAGSSFGMTTAYSPMELPTQAPSYDFEVGMTQLSDVYKDTDIVQERMWGVPVTSERPEKAVEFLNFMYTNTEVANLLSHGLEGINYEKTDVEGVVNKIDNANPGYARIFTMFGDQTKVYYNTPAQAGIQDEIAAFAKTAKPTTTLGYVFDSASVSAKAAAVSNVVQQYGPALAVGMVDDVAAALDQIVEAMNQAGMEEVIAENQKQLNEWLANQK